MASILERYGIKEVANLTFYSIDANTGRPRTPVLYIDTAKVTTVESTAETTYAQGGQGNGRLLAWDFGKEITMSIEDAVFSPKSLSIMFGEGDKPAPLLNNGDVTDVTNYNNKRRIYKTIQLNTLDVAGALAKDATGIAVVKLINEALGNVNDSAITDAALVGPASTNKIKWDSTFGHITFTSAFSQIGGDYPAYALALTPSTTTPTIKNVDDDSSSNYTDYATYSGSPASWSIAAKGDPKLFASLYLNPDDGFVINVGPDSFPGTYYITADTYARSEASGEDQFFQIIIPKGKVTSENTLTLEAEGDPTVFNMNVQVLRATVNNKNVMMQLVQYSFGTGSSTEATNFIDQRLQSTANPD